MDIIEVERASFAVIGKEGSTADGPGFIAALWEDANSHFEEVAHLAKRDGEGNLVGIWGAMSDFSRSFQPWENGFSRGLYLAGVECYDDSHAPEGWTKWTVPGGKFYVVKNESERTFPDMIAWLEEHHIPLAGAVHDHTDPKTGEGYLYFPVKITKE